MELLHVDIHSENRPSIALMLTDLSAKKRASALGRFKFRQ